MSDQIATISSAIYTNDADKVSQAFDDGLYFVSTAVASALHDTATEEIARIVRDRCPDTFRRTAEVIALTLFGPVNWLRTPVATLLPDITLQHYIHPATLGLLVKHYHSIGNIDNLLANRGKKSPAKSALIEACLPFEAAAISCFRYAFLISDGELVKKVYDYHKDIICAKYAIESVAERAYIMNWWAPWMPEVTNRSGEFEVSGIDGEPIERLIDAAFIHACFVDDLERAKELMATGDVDITASDHCAFKGAGEACRRYLISLCPRYQARGICCYVAADELPSWYKVRDGLFCDIDEPIYYSVKEWFDGLCHTPAAKVPR